MLTLSGRTAVITGATGHLGSGIVRSLVEGGMNVVMVTHNPDQAASLIDELDSQREAEASSSDAGRTGQGRAPGRCVAITNENGDESVFGEVARRFGSVDVLIPNHGAPLREQSLEAITGEDMDQLLHHQITHSFLMIQKALPYLKESRAGRIVLMSCVGAENGLKEEGLADCAARGGVISMTRYLAGILAPDGITVNCIAKGGLENDHPTRQPGELDAAVLTGRIPLGRCGTPEELGALTVYLVSEEAGFMTGQVLRLNGGLHFG